MMSFDALHNIVLTQFSSFSKTIILSALNKLAHGTLTVHIDESDDLDSKAETFVFGSGKPEAEITVRSKNVWTRLAMNLDLGTAEAYMLRELEINDIVSLLLLFLTNIASLGQGSWLLQLLPKLQRYLLKPTNNERQALENAGHYDTSNYLFSCFLSPDMSYSSAIWKTDSNEDESLGDAQLRKVHSIIDKARIRKHHHILDIGGGWCFLAIEAVKKTGCKVTVTTLSVEQKALGDKRVQDAGLEGNIEIFLCDYRKTPVPEGGYDRIVSVEMLEHVGREYMDTYFATISSMLNPTDGIMVVQGITAINKLHENPDKMDTFLERYIFPNGYLPSIHRLVDSIHVGSNGSLEIDSVQSIGPHYVKTLRTWRANFIKNWADIRQDFEAEKKEKSDGKFTEAEVEAWKRRWVYYFSFCEAAFRGGVLGDHVVVARRRPSPDEADGVPF